MENDNKLKNRNVMTYTDEMVKAIENDKGGLIKKIIHEEEEHEAEKSNLSPKSKKNRLFMLIGIFLIISALATLIFLAFFDEKINTVSIIPQATSIIFSDQTDFRAIDGFSKEKIVETILGQVNNTKVKVGGINVVYLTENSKVIGFKRLNTLMKTNLVLNQDDLISNNFILGIFKSGLKSTSANAGDYFMLLKVKSFADIFPVMRNWESKMLYDLGGFFETKISPETNYLFTKDFEDGIVANKNARILKDNNGKIVLMYVFADDNYVVITNSENAVTEVILRLNSTKIKK